MSEPTLYEKIMARAKTDIKNSAELRRMALDLDTAIKSPAMSASLLLSVWAKTRKRWCEITGEPLVPRSVTRTAAGLFKALQRKRA